MYSLVADARQPRPARPAKRPSGAGPVRLLPLDVQRPDVRSAARAPRASRPHQLKQWLVVSDVPLDRYGEAAINKRLSDLDWVARAAVAHESVIEAFGAAAGVLPMKLFTIFTSDERALEHVRRQRSAIDAVLKRVISHDEWGVRIVLDPARAPNGRRAKRQRKASGAGYLAEKKAQRDQAAELAGRAREVVADLYDGLATRASLAKRRAAGELPIKGGPLLLDAAFLVPRSRVRSFRAAVARQARIFEPQGYRITLSGPWPPYTFLTE